MEKRKAVMTGLVFLVLLSLAFNSVAQAAQSPTISVSPASIEVSHGETFTIEIMVDPKGEEIYAAQYDLYFDNNLLTATSQTRGTFLSQDGVDTIEVINKINTTAGKGEYGETRAGKGGIRNSGILASISFEVIGTSGKSDLKLGDVILASSDLEELKPEINHGICKIGEVPGKLAVDITVEEAYHNLEKNPDGFILLDVSTEQEYDAEHIDMPEVKLINIPKNELENRLGELNRSKEIIVYSRTGERSKAASATLVKHDFEHVYNMLGGIEAWRRNYPITLPTPTPAVSSIPAFEAVFTIIALLVISYFISKRRRR